MNSIFKNLVAGVFKNILKRNLPAKRQYVSPGEVIGTTDIDNDCILSVHLLKDKSPVIVFYERMRGTIANVTEYFILYKGERLGPYDIVLNVHVFEDGDTIAYRAKINGKYYMFIGKDKIGPFNEVSDLKFFPGKKNFAYTAREDNAYYVFVGKDKEGPYDDIEGLILSPNGKTAAYNARIDNEHYVVEGNKKTSCYKFSKTLYFSPDGTLAYTDELSYGGMDSTHYLIAGGKRAESPCKIKHIVFSPDGKNMAYIIPGYIITTDDKIGPFDSIGGTGLYREEAAYISNDKKLAYIAQVDGKEYVFVGKEKAGPFDYASDLIISPDWKTVAYHVTMENDGYIFVGQKWYGPFVRNCRLILSGDGSTVGFLALPHDTAPCWYVFVGNRTVGPVMLPDNLILSYDGKKEAYSGYLVGKDGLSDGYYVFTERYKAGPFDNIEKEHFEALPQNTDTLIENPLGEGAARPLRFSFDGEVLEYIAGMYGKIYNKILINGKSYPGGITPDGKAVYIKDGNVMLR